MPAAVPQLLSASLSEQGYVRPNNEDRVHCDDGRGIYMVVDGMGGHAAGEQAATIAVERIRARLERPTDTPEQRLREAIALANNAIHEAAQSNPAWQGMACVLTAAIVEGEQVTVGHVGDSRLYKIRRGVIHKITRDHSPIGEREDAGEITESEAMQHPRRNEVYRDVGSGERAPDDPDFIDIFRFALEPDSALLLCSDGLSDVLASEQILRIVEENAAEPSAVVKLLVAAATRLGHDNVSAIFVEGESFPRSGGVRGPSRTALNEPEAERTDRLAAQSLHEALRPWYGGRPAYFAYGTTIGGLIVSGIVLWLLHQSVLQRSRVLVVVAPATIGQVLASAQPGDTVVLGPGTYPEVVHLKNGVNVVAQTRREAVIEGSVSAESGVHARLEGIRVRAADLGIAIQDSAVTLIDDEVSGASDAGIQFSGASRGVVTACHIHDNPGAGLAVLGTAEPEIRNNVITSNGTASGKLRPGLLVRSAATLLVSGNIFAGNGSDAVWLPGDDPRLLQSNAFSLGPAGEKHAPVRIVAREERQP